MDCKNQLRELIKLHDKEIRDKAIDDFQEALVERYNFSKEVNEKFAYLDLDDVDKVARVLKGEEN